MGNRLTTPKPAGRRGRPTLQSVETRRSEFVQTAARVFLEHGFGATTLERLASAAGVSTKTIYEQFGNKTNLFRAVMRMKSDRLIRCETPRQTGPPAAVLTQLGTTLLDLLLEPETVALQRVVLAEAWRFPELAATFYTNGPRRGLRLIASYLRSAQRRGQLGVDRPEVAAEHFLYMATGDLVRRALLGIDPCPAPAVRRRKVAAAVNRLLATLA